MAMRDSPSLSQMKRDKLGSNQSIPYPQPFPVLYLPAQTSKEGLLCLIGSFSFGSIYLVPGPSAPLQPLKSNLQTLRLEFTQASSSFSKSNLTISLSPDSFSLSSQGKLWGKSKLGTGVPQISTLSPLVLQDAPRACLSASVHTLILHSAGLPSERGEQRKGLASAPGELAHKVLLEGASVLTVRWAGA